MKVESLVSKVLFKAAPMTGVEKEELTTKMELWFDQQKKAAKMKDADEAQTLNIKDKIFLFMDEWYMRVIFAALYVFLVKWVQDFMNPEDPDEDPLDDYQEKPRR